MCRTGRDPDRTRFARYLPALPETATVSYRGVATEPIRTADGYHAGHTYWHPLAEVDDLADLADYPFPAPAHAPPAAELTRQVAQAKADEITVAGDRPRTNCSPPPARRETSRRK